MANFDRKSVNRIARQTKRLEKQSYNSPTTASRYPLTLQNVGKQAVVVDTITGGSISTPGKGTAKLWTFDPDEETSTENEGDPVKVYNNQGGTVAAGATIFVTWSDGAWWAVVAPCSNS